MSAWLRRFGLHLAAAVGATGIFVAAAAVGANQSRPPSTASSVVLADVSPSPSALPTDAPRPRRTPTPIASPGTAAVRPSPGPGTPRPSARVIPERSLAGKITTVDATADAVEVLGTGGRTWRVTPAPGALLRLNGRTVKLEAFQSGDQVVILGQAATAPAVTGQGPRQLLFTAHAITARRADLSVINSTS